MKEPESAPTYSISDLAKEFAITTRSIRHYEEYGLIAPERRGTYRVYSAKNRTRLQLILRGKRIGFSLAEIKEIIDLYQFPHGEEKQTEFLLAKIELRRQQLQQQLSDIESMLSEIDDLEQRISAKRPNPSSSS
ncbi:MerR family transcriptional regulator [Pleionea litopenaei]|uniref:MerR family DNA-binding transcriptional regulator n=1 Tax=Pleionea litopenaei TaxID=3070815 RepID=A0AA51RVJ9_9GAMM|nr:MerR family DNA-binding transcriptional regulator [Pleionea sp. HL-JVS1]WMS88259.1 MerR family DNA-binding transcriptional regulator [Pleionea sp. HL-JVS1]